MKKVEDHLPVMPEIKLFPDYLLWNRLDKSIPAEEKVEGKVRRQSTAEKDSIYGRRQKGTLLQASADKVVGDNGMALGIHDGSYSTISASFQL
jgi:hypothetical protein